MLATTQRRGRDRRRNRANVSNFQAEPPPTERPFPSVSIRVHPWFNHSHFNSLRPHTDLPIRNQEWTSQLCRWSEIVT